MCELEQTTYDGDYIHPFYGNTLHIYTREPMMKRIKLINSTSNNKTIVTERAPKKTKHSANNTQFMSKTNCHKRKNIKNHNMQKDDIKKCKKMPYEYDPIKLLFL